MVSILLEADTQTKQGSNSRNCDGCPRCDDSGSKMCNIPHPKYGNRHPICKICGHCVLRGRHQDDAADLDDHPGFEMPPPPSLN